jgi:hypothetical protein
MIPRFLSLLFLSFVIVMGATPARAGKQASTFVPKIIEVKPDSIKVKTGQNSGYKVSAPDEQGLQRTQEAANVETYKVTQLTTVTINSKPAKLSDLKKGMEVKVTIGIDRNTAASIAVKVDR